MPKTKLTLPAEDKHKSQNGKLLIVGGSHLFHAASLWSAAVAAHLVDMVFYSSTSDNNELIKIAKNAFRDGIVLERGEILAYASEADVILLGPGMIRVERQRAVLEQILAEGSELTPQQWQTDTYLVTNYLLRKFSTKKFVLDAGALQMVEPDFLTRECILTPHQGEWRGLTARAEESGVANQLAIATTLLKDIVDGVWQNGQLLTEIPGGNAGLTKGGSGDALAGLVAGLYCYNEAVTACEWASLTLKKTAEKLFTKVGPFFTTSELGEALMPTLWELYQSHHE